MLLKWSFVTILCNFWYYDLVYIFKDILCTKKLVSWNCAIVVVQYWCEIHLINCIFRFNTLWIQCIYMMEHYTMIKKQNRLKFSIVSSWMVCLKFIDIAYFRMSLCNFWILLLLWIYWITNLEILFWIIPQTYTRRPIYTKYVKVNIREKFRESNSIEPQNSS